MGYIPFLVGLDGMRESGQMIILPQHDFRPWGCVTHATGQIFLSFPNEEIHKGHNILKTCERHVKDILKTFTLW